MAAKIRLMRLGRRKRPFYRIVVADSKARRDGKFIEILGFYNPMVEPAEVKLDEDKALGWLKNGATPTDSAKSILSKKGIMQKYHEFRYAAK